MKKYLVIDEHKDGNGDVFVKVCDDKAWANTEAKIQWNHFTTQEQKKRHIYVVVVTEDYLNDDAIDEDGNIDWNVHHSCDTEIDFFDSANL